MKIQQAVVAVGVLLGLVVSQAPAQPSYPQARPRPKPSPSATPTSEPSPAASPSPEASPSPGSAATPSGPLKMISSDGTNQKSPIKVLELECYDSGYGTRYNSEMRLSGAVQNSGAETLKKVTVKYQLLDTAGQVIQEWKELPGQLKGGQTYRINPGVARNSLGTLLKGKIVVEHEELPPKASGSGKASK